MSQRQSWDEVWMRVAYDVAMRSRCVRARIGAVIVDDTNRIIATGYNGPPAGYAVQTMRHGESCDNFCPRAIAGKLASGYDDCVAIHAEANALLFCDREVRIFGTMYVTGAVCYACAKLIGNSGLHRVVQMINDNEEHRDPMRSADFMRGCGITVDVNVT